MNSQNKFVQKGTAADDSDNDDDIHDEDVKGRRKMIKNGYHLSNAGSSRIHMRSANSPMGISNFSISNNQVSQITKPSAVDPMQYFKMGTAGGGGQFDNK